MNSTAMTRLTHAVMIVAALAAIVIALPVKAQPARSGEVVTLPRVVVTGKRVAGPVVEAKVVRLPRVVVNGHRVDDGATRQAQREQAVKPAAMLIASR